MEPLHTKMGTNKQPNIYVNPQSTTKKSVATGLNISEWLYLSFGSAEGKVEINGKRKQKGVASLVLSYCCEACTPFHFISNLILI